MLPSSSLPYLSPDLHLRAADCRAGLLDVCCLLTGWPCSEDATSGEEACGIRVISIAPGHSTMPRQNWLQQLLYGLTRAKSSSVVMVKMRGGEVFLVTTGSIHTC